VEAATNVKRLAVFDDLLHPQLLRRRKRLARDEARLASLLI